MGTTSSQDEHIVDIHRFKSQSRTISPSDSFEARFEPAQTNSESESHLRPRRRFLCLHGHGSNSDITRIQVGSLQLRDRHAIDCDYFQGAHIVEARDPSLNLFSEGPFRSWVSAENGESALAQSLHDIMAVVTQFGPYDGIFGFSLGAMLATALSSPTVWCGMFGFDHCPWKMVLCACAGGARFAPSYRVPQLSPTQDESASLSPVLPFRHDFFGDATLDADDRIKNVRSLHVIGSRDWSKADSETIRGWFAEAESIEVPCGHELPMSLRRNEDLRGALEAFFHQRDETATSHSR